jgi:hypothetical protein
MRALGIVLGGGLLVLGQLAACGSPQGKGAEPASGGGGAVASGGSGGTGSGSATASASIDVRMRVGHYASPDGAIAFHLDRTDEKAARLRYDGSKETVLLEPRQGPFGRIDYVQAGRGVLLHVYTDGRVVIYHRDRPDGVDVARDDLKRPGAAAAAARPPLPKKDQSVDVKMRLGHFASGDGVMTFVLDRQGDKVAKLRYDGSKEIIQLEPRQGPSGRIDYVREGQGVLLHVYSDGGVLIYHRDRPDGVRVSRDGDADPL